MEELKAQAWIGTSAEAIRPPGFPGRAGSYASLQEGSWFFISIPDATSLRIPWAIKPEEGLLSKGYSKYPDVSKM
jgi:hypothetical protein